MFFIVYILFFPFCFVHPCFMSQYMYLLVTHNPIPHTHIIRTYNKLLIYLSIYLISCFTPTHLRAIGIQANLWSETVRTKADRDEMLWPRVFALAERAWHKSAWEDITDIDEDYRQNEKALYDLVNIVLYKYYIINILFTYDDSTRIFILFSY